jgi:hypothetical protein
VRRILKILAAILLLAGATVLTWKLLDWPSPRLLLTYGLPPAGGATGRTKEIVGIEFVEVAPGYVWADAHGLRCTPGDWIGRLGAPVGISIGDAPVHDPDPCRWWQVYDRPMWISRYSVSWLAALDAARRSGARRWASAGSHEDVVAMLDARLTGSFRLPTKLEAEFAWRSGAIELPPHLYQFGPQPDAATERLLLRTWKRNDTYRFWNGDDLFRIVWIPDSVEGPP